VLEGSEGQTLLECALVLSILVPLILIFFHIMGFFYYRAAAVQIATVAAETASMTGDPVSFDRVIRASFAELDSDLDVLSVSKSGQPVVSVKLVDPSDNHVIEDLGNNWMNGARDWTRGNGLIVVELDLDLPSTILSRITDNKLTRVNVRARKLIRCAPIDGGSDCI